LEVRVAAGVASLPITIVLVVDDPADVVYARDSLEIHKSFP
jgi:hypothetical protein